MGLIPCPLSIHLEKESQSHSHHLHSESSSSLSSQPSLPSVPSLTSSLRHEEPSSVHCQCISTLRGHSSYVFSLTLEGKYLYSGSCEKEIRVWSRDPFPQEHHVNENLVAIGQDAVKCLVVLGDKLFSAHQDHKIRIWKIDYNNPYQKYKCLATLPTVNDRMIKLFSTKNYVQVRRHKKCTWVHHVDTVSALALSKDGSNLYSVSWDRTLKIWRTSDFKCLESVPSAHDDAINAIAVSNDGYVYTGSADRKIKVWRKCEKEKKHALVSTLEKHKSAVNALVLSTDGCILYSGACDRSIVVWERVVNAADNVGQHIVVAGALRGHTKAILCLVVVSDLLCSGSADKTVRIWRRETEKSYSCLAVLEGHRGPIKCLSGTVDTKDGTKNDSSNSYLVYSGSLDCDIKVWKIRAPSLQQN